VRSGGGLFDQPEYELPNLPHHLGELNDDSLMDLFVEYTAWLNYVSVQFAEAEVEEERAEARLELFKARGMALNWDLDDVKDKKVTVARARMLASPEYQELQNEYLVAYARRKMTTAICSGCERSAALVSRELSRRIGQAGGERRNSRWST
jgi:hypothetical protein